MSDNPSFKGFERDSRESWSQRAEKELKGKPLSDVDWSSREGHTSSPINFESDHTPLQVPSSSKWVIREQINSVDILKNEVINSGVEHVVVSADIAEQLNDAEIKKLSDSGIRLSLSSSNLTSIQNIPSEFYPFDNGGSLENMDLSYATGTEVERTYVADGAMLADEGAYPSQEIGLALAQAHDLLVSFLEQGVDAVRAANCIGFRLASGLEFYPELAKIRALRLLWKSVVSQYGDSDVETCIISRSSLWMMTSVEPKNNLLRTATSAVSSIVGGADEIEVLPFDTLSGGSVEGRRLARNITNLLRHESHLDKVNNVSDGSYFLDTVTSKMADASWELFKEVEQKGGYSECLKSGFVSSLIKDSAEKQKADAENGKIRITGVNRFVDESVQISLSNSLDYLSKSLEQQLSKEVAR